ncbi:unnamed protein product [Staurois parvus]|uniref:Uncharacterized protein n=1 Tax=Staurois parvus TaxID=386267 RepID=A0ABN9G3Q1_9NEOB|nr:unnamed protein product [Staurois parvus]
MGTRGSKRGGGFHDSVCTARLLFPGISRAVKLSVFLSLTMGDSGWCIGGSGSGRLSWVGVKGVVGQCQALSAWGRQFLRCLGQHKT